jgi:hypothetical protein
MTLFFYMPGSPDLMDHGQISLVRGLALAGGKDPPGSANGVANAREVKRALRDPEFARAFRHRLTLEALIYIVLAECLLIVFFGIGYLALR